MEKMPQKKEELTIVNNVLKLASDLLKVIKKLIIKLEVNNIIYYKII